MKQRIQQLMMGSSLPKDTLLNTGWLLFRLHIGLSIAIHAGWPKMNTLAAPGWFNDQVAGLGYTFPSPAFWATLASWGEFVGGIGIALGLLTRFNAFQLAFQFFVISFIWFDKPEPLTGMYFQQTLFWAYVLTVFAGSGRFSIDHLILNRKKTTLNVPIKPAVAAVLILILFVNPLQAQPGTRENKTTINDFKPFTGKWKGQLTYLDYTSNKPVTMPANTLFEMVSDSSFDQFIYYTDEPHKNADSRYTIREKGSMLNEMKLVERKAEKEKLLLVFEYRGPDGNDNRMATMQRIIELTGNELKITKMVKYDGEGKFIQRHQYHFIRAFE
jgi:uncharacterized membrane protein YphA (DoxX/SURF4 family)